MLLPLLEEGAILGVFTPEAIDWLLRIKFAREMLVLVCRLWFLDWIELGTGLFVLEIDSTFAGFCLLSYKPLMGKVIITINNMIIKSEYRGRGFGKYLLREIESLCVGDCILRCKCTSKAASMIALTQKNGFKIKRVAKPIQGNVTLPFLLEKTLFK